MKFEFKNGLIWIPIEIEYDEKTIKIENCILDTGSATTAIDIDLIDFNYKKASIVKRLIGIGGGVQEVIGQEVKKIMIDGHLITDVEIEFGDIQEDLGVNGFIGTDLLKYFDVFLRFSTEEIIFGKD